MPAKGLGTVPCAVVLAVGPGFSDSAGQGATGVRSPGPPLAFRALTRGRCCPIMFSPRPRWRDGPDLVPVQGRGIGCQSRPGCLVAPRPPSWLCPSPYPCRTVQSGSLRHSPAPQHAAHARERPGHCALRGCACRRSRVQRFGRAGGNRCQITGPAVGISGLDKGQMLPHHVLTSAKVAGWPGPGTGSGSWEIGGRSRPGCLVAPRPPSWSSPPPYRAERQLATPPGVAAGHAAAHSPAAAHVAVCRTRKTTNPTSLVISRRLLYGVQCRRIASP